MLAVPSVWVVEVVEGAEVGCSGCLGWLFKVCRLVVHGVLFVEGVEVWLLRV